MIGIVDFSMRSFLKTIKKCFGILKDDYWYEDRTPEEIEVDMKKLREKYPDTRTKLPRIYEWFVW